MSSEQHAATALTSVMLPAADTAADHNGSVVVSSPAPLTKNDGRRMSGAMASVFSPSAPHRGGVEGEDLSICSKTSMVCSLHSPIPPLNAQLSSDRGTNASAFFTPLKHPSESPTLVSSPDSASPVGIVQSPLSANREGVFHPPQPSGAAPSVCTGQPAQQVSPSNVSDVSPPPPATPGDPPRSTFRLPAVVGVQAAPPPAAAAESDAPGENCQQELSHHSPDLTHRDLFLQSFVGTSVGNVTNSVASMPAHVVLRQPKLVKSSVNGLRTINNRYTIVKELGRGSCGKVHLAYDNTEHRLVAIKSVRRAKLTPNRIGGPTDQQRVYNAFLSEVAIMKNLRHRNVVAIYEVIDDASASKMYLVMQFVEKGPIAQVTVRPDSDVVCTPVPPTLLLTYARQILAGVEYLHSHGVVHRDIKPENILVNKAGRAFLADFGVAETFDKPYHVRVSRMVQHSVAQSVAQSVTQNVSVSHIGGPQVLGTKGTMLFIAPELWDGAKTFGKPVDMWALGVTLFILLTGKLPFSNLADIHNMELPAIPTSYGPQWTMLLRGLLDRDPLRRLSAPKARAMVKKMIGRGTRSSEGPAETAKREGSHPHNQIIPTEEQIRTALTHTELAGDSAGVLQRTSSSSSSNVNSLASSVPIVDFGLFSVEEDAWRNLHNSSANYLVKVTSHGRDEPAAAAEVAAPSGHGDGLSSSLLSDERGGWKTLTEHEALEKLLAVGKADQERRAEELHPSVVRSRPSLMMRAKQAPLPPLKTKGAKVAPPVVAAKAPLQITSVQREVPKTSVVQPVLSSVEHFPVQPHRPAGLRRMVRHVFRKETDSRLPQ